MTISTLILIAAGFAGQAGDDRSHDQNEIYRLVIRQGLEAGGETFKLPASRLFDGQDGDAQRAALKEVTGSDREVDVMLRPSVTAPHIIRVRDQKTAVGTIRAADVWFAVYADLDKIDPAQEAIRADKKEVEVGNMWFQTRLLQPTEITAAGVTAPTNSPERKTWFSHVHSRLLDRIDFEVTNQVMATKSPQSFVVASRTDSAFPKDGPDGNRWKTTTRDGAANDSAALHPYPGGISYARMTRLAFKPGAILVEIHMAFLEPTEWFDNKPILRSKFSVAAQDQIRTLRRELAKKR
jgi:hypothetical protein